MELLTDKSTARPRYYKGKHLYSAEREFKRYFALSGRVRNQLLTGPETLGSNKE